MSDKTTSSSAEWAPCPFCGSVPYPEGEGFEHHQTDNCVLDSLWMRADELTEWNTRVQRTDIDTSTEAVERLLDGVTPGPWAADGEDQGAAWGMAWSVCRADNLLNCVADGVDTEANVRFIAAARDLVPALQKERDEARAALATPCPDAVQEAAIDIAAIENGGKRWHGEDHRVVAVRWEPYKPDGQRQMKAKGRWQEQVGSGDYWRWQNCDRPAAIAKIKGGDRE